MANLPVTGYLENAARTEGEMKDALEDIRDKLSQQIGTDTASSVTISGGAFTPATRDTGGVFVVDTEGAASADDLNTIATTNVEDGSFIYVFAANVSRVVTVKDSVGGTGQVITTDNADFVLDALDKWILLRLDGTDWKEVDRSYGADNESIQNQIQIAPTLEGSHLCPHENLVITRPSASTLTVTADRVVLENANGFQKVFNSINITIDITASGALGIDTGSEANSTWYHIWIIGQADGTKSGVLSTSTTAPTLPSGYTFYGYVGACYNTSSGDLLEMCQTNNSATFENGAFSAALTDGSATSYTSISLSSFIPSTANHLIGSFVVRNTTGSASGLFIAATSGGLGLYYFQNQATTQSNVYVPAMVPLHESQLIYYKVAGSSQRATVIPTGWAF
jgi:hypothetical protein